MGLSETRSRRVSGTQAAQPNAAPRPFFFPVGDRRLFGVYHAPEERARDCGVVLCYPAGHEYLRCHRGFLDLAKRLARAGFPVLRFDYHGCGDSPGEIDEASLETWVDDVCAAAIHMRGRSRASRLCLVGLRLGANLAMTAGARLSGVDLMAVWQPVRAGGQYLAGIRQVHAELARKFGASAEESEIAPGYDGATDIVGFPVSAAMLEEIGEIDLLAARDRPARRVLLIDNTETRDEERLYEHLASLTERCDYVHVPEPRFWEAEPYEAVMPVESIRSLSSWISGAAV